MLKIGDEAPGFEATDQFGQIHLLSGYRGGWVVLYFYPKDETPGCTVEASAFRDVYRELRRKAAVLGVSADSLESHEKFAERHLIPYPLLSDPERHIIGAYGAEESMLGSRITFLIDPEGKIAEIYDNVVPEWHAEEILRDLAVEAV